METADIDELMHEVLRRPLASADDALSARAGLLALSRDLGIEATRRVRLATALAMAMRRVCATGGGRVALATDGSILKVRIDGPADALRPAWSRVAELLGEGAAVDLAADGDGAATLWFSETGTAEEPRSGGSKAPLDRSLPHWWGGAVALGEPDGDAATELAAALAEEERELTELLALMDEQAADLERLNRELEETHRGVVALYAELDEKDRHKNEFLATLAHELRNPMSVIGTALHTLRTKAEAAAAGDEPASPAGPQRLVQVAERQLRHLARLVDDLLDVSRIDQNKINLKREPVDLAEIVERAVETCRPAIDANAHELVVELAAEPLPLIADADRIEQVVSNLLTNATKYTPEHGRIELAVTRGEDEAVITVTDNGIGIRPEMLESVFQLFAQGDQSLDRGEGGLGLGLSLVQGLVELHGGSTKAQSAGEGQGSRFIVRLPLAAAGPPADRAPAAGESSDGGPRRQKAESSRTEKPSVLLVEDNEDAREMMAMLLEGRGYRVGTAAEGFEGVEMATSGGWEVAIVDIGLPGIDGYEVARRVRAAPGGERLALIALSGYGRPEDREKSLAAGFDRHLVKPVEPDELFRLLSEGV